MDIRRIKVTPDQAKEWIDNHKNYRKLRTHVVQRYAGDMSRGNWTDCGETIKFDSGGQITDGQHRLAAIVLSGVTIEMWAAFGVDDVRNIDSNFARTQADALYAEMGTDYSDKIVAIYKRLALCHLAGINKVSHQITKSDVIDFVSANPFMLSAVDSAVKLKKDKVISIAEVGACIMQANYMDADISITESYLEAIRCGLGLSKGDPAHTVREKLIVTNFNGASSLKMRMWCILRGLRASMLGERLTILRYDPICPMPSLVKKINKTA